MDVPAGAHEVQFTWRCYASDPTAAAAQRAWVDQVAFADYTAQPPALVAQPSDLALGENYPLSLGVAVTGALPYRPILRREGITNVFFLYHRSQLILPLDEVPAYYAGAWQLIVTNNFGAMTSQVFSITVTSSPPLIRWGPNSTETGLGDSLELSSRVTGSAPLHLQWLKDGVDLPDQNSGTIFLPVTVASDAGIYHLVVTNAFGMVTSQVATVTLTTDPPVIITEPLNQSLTPGAPLDLWVEAGGSSPLHFQWQKNGVDLEGENYSSLWRDTVTSADAGDYQVIVTNLFGAATSVVATVSFSGPLAEALDNSDLLFSSLDELTPWALTTDVTHDGQDAAQSGPTDHNARSGLTTTLMGPGILQFWWKISSEPDNDRFEFIVNDSPLATASGEVDWGQRTFELGAGTHNLLWRYIKNGSLSEGADAAWLDQVEWTPLITGTLNEAVDEPALVFTDGGFVPWFFQVTNTHDGLDAAQSAPVGNGERSVMRTTVLGPGDMSFWWKVSSEEGGDYMEFKVDGEPLDHISGEADWASVSVSLGLGNHEVQWEYVKDGSGSEGADAGWVDEVVWTPDAPPTLAEALDMPAQEFTVDNNWPWFVQTTNTYDGVDAVQSSLPPVNSRSWIQTTITGPGTLSFWAQMSAAPSDSLEFTLDSWTRTVWMGDSEWQYFSYEIEPGAHLVGWGFRKRSEQVVGHNTVFLDEIVFTPRTAPTILNPPQPVKLLKNQSFSLYVNAVGDLPLEYQWQKNGTNIPGANDPTYSRSGAGYGDTGDYSVAVINASGAVTSSWTRVAVVPGFYTIRNLGTLGTGDAESEAYDVNNHGEVVGRALNNEHLVHGFVWTGSGIGDLGDGRTAINVDPTNRLPGTSCAYAINDNFDIVGYFEYRVSPTLSGFGHAAYWRQVNCGMMPPVPPGSHCPAELIDLHPRPHLLDTVAVGVNQRRQIVLQGGLSWVLAHSGFLLTPQDPADRFSPVASLSLGGGSDGLDPYAINNTGVVVGRYREFIGGDMPYIYDGVGQMGIANGFPVPFSRQVFSAINDRGVIAGFYYTNNAQGLMVRHGFLQHADGRFELLSDAVSGLYNVCDINNRNQVVGNGHGGVLYTDGYVFRLNDLLVGESSVDIRSANAINEQGQIVGQASFPYGVGSRAYLLTPGNPGNHPPVAQADALVFPRRGTVLIPTASLLANDHDQDANPLHLDAVTSDDLDGRTLSGGRITREAGVLRYTSPNTAVVGDTFSYSVTDGVGGSDTAQVTITFSDAAPPPVPLINPPEILPNGTVQLSGRAPAGSTVWIYRTANPAFMEWVRDATLTVPASGEWLIARPGEQGGQPLFYRAETSGQP
jgi:probable HAF family extracellular repeat protein